MSSLKTQLRRLFLGPDSQTLVDPQGCTRALVLELPAPVDAAALSAAWRAAQADLGWPAPAIAVSGQGLQLWSALAEPVPLPTAEALAGALSRRLLPELPARQRRHWPDAGRTAELPGQPLAQGDGERWSAFVAPDLAPLFTETPWLDLPPGDDGQAALLAALACVTPAQLAALQSTPPAAADPAPVSAAPEGGMADSAEARRFLRQVMNDPSVPLALRVDAAKALLMAPPGR